VEWHYNQTPEPGSPEAISQQWLRKDVDWLVAEAELV